MQGPQFTSIFYKIRTKIPEDILRMIYFAFVHSQLLYGIEVCANTTPSQLTQQLIITLNNKLLRILQRNPTRSHTVELYKIYYTLPVQLLHNSQISTFIHKMMWCMRHESCGIVSRQVSSHYSAQWMRCK